LTRTPLLRVDFVRRIYGDGKHNAFTDLCLYKGIYYCTFRSCPEGHMLFSSSRIRVLASDDAVKWREVFQFSVPQRDVRDPHFLRFKNRLFVYSGTWLVPEPGAPADMNAHLGYGAWTADGQAWEGPTLLEGTYGHYIWRAASFGGSAYLCGRRRRGFAPGIKAEAEAANIEGAMLESGDGLAWRVRAFFTQDYGDETAFLIEKDGAVLALARGAEKQPARICRSRPPYKRWTRVDLDRNVGGPMLSKWGSRYLVGGRKTMEPGKPRTALYWLADNALIEAAELPSGGDNSYPGFVPLSPTRGLLTWYSSHEGGGRSPAPASIYLAELRIE
jgi:hypothetical protein